MRFTQKVPKHYSNNYPILNYSLIYRRKYKCVNLLKEKITPLLVRVVTFIHACVRLKIIFFTPTRQMPRNKNIVSRNCEICCKRRGILDINIQIHLIH